MTNDRPVRVAIDAQLMPGPGIGVEQVLVGLIRSLGELPGVDEYIIVTPPNAPDWPSRFLGPNQRIVVGPGLIRWPTLQKSLGPLRPMAAGAFRRGRNLFQMNPMSNRRGSGAEWRPSRFHQGLGVDVIHFPVAQYASTSIPTVFNPHDLQHIHFPHFFSEHEIQLREERYRAGCELAQVVVVGSEWARRDFIEHYGLQPEKVQVIPWAAPTSTHSEVDADTLASAAADHASNGPFVLFPAATWKHKNHIALLQAVAWLRDNEDLRVQLVCTGSKTDHWPHIERELNRLNLGDQVKFLGVVPVETLKALYRLTQFVVFPSLYEPASAPVMEAWSEGVPVACSSVAGFPEQVDDGAYMFDPNSVPEITNALRVMSSDEAVRNGVRDRGLRRSQKFSWDKTARAYRALYRKLAGRVLDPDELKLLSENWTIS